MPEPVRDVEFSSALRGYEKTEVDTFLRELAEEHNRLIAELAAARRSAEKAHLELGEEMGELLQHAKDIADGLVKKAGEEASLTIENGRRTAEATVAEARRLADDLTRTAEAAAVTRVREAQQKVAALQELETEVRSHLTALQHTARSLDSEIARTAGQAPIEQEVFDDAGEVAALTSPK
jgi:cell division initiation protein